MIFQILNLARLDQDLFDLIFQILDLGIQLRPLLARDRRGDDGTAHATRAAQGGFGLHEDVPVMGEMRVG